MAKKIAFIILIIATVLWTAFIFSNSLDNAEESTEKSSTVTEAVNKVASAVGIEEEISHSTVRDMAHFTEFALLALLLAVDIVILIYSKLSSSPFKLLAICAASLPACFILACVDELIQKFSGGRASQFSDVLLDTLGALCGIIGFSVIYIIFYAIKRHKLKLRINRQKQ